MTLFLLVVAVVVFAVLGLIATIQDVMTERRLVYYKLGYGAGCLAISVLFFVSTLPLPSSYEQVKFVYSFVALFIAVDGYKSIGSGIRKLRSANLVNTLRGKR